MVLSPDEQTLYVCFPRQVVAWDLEDGCVRRQFPLGPAAFLTAIAISPNGDLLASGSFHDLFIWNVRSGKLVRILHNLTLDGLWTALAFLSRQRILAGSKGYPLEIWDLSANKRLLILPNSATGKFFPGASLSPNGQLLAYPQAHWRLLPHGLQEKQPYDIQVWNFSTGKVDANLTGHLYDENSVVFSPDGHFVCGAMADSTVRIWDIQTGKLVQTFQNEHLGQALSVALAPDGKHAVTLWTDNTMRCYNLQNGTLTWKKSLAGRTAQVLYFSHGTRLVTLGIRGVSLWDAETGAFRKHLSNNTRIVHKNKAAQPTN